MNKSREELLQNLIEKIRCVIRGMHVGHPFGELTLGKPQIGILFSLARDKNGLSVKELAEKLNVTSGAITQFIDGLVEKKLVNREEDSKDRRIMKILLTKNAEDKFKDFKKNYFKSVSPLFDNLKDAEITQLITLLNKIEYTPAKDIC
jgi:DNA-binding MarR family transcriptional regulator